MIYNEVQEMVDNNQYTSGRVTESNTMQSDQYVLYISNEGMKHILDRHSDEYAPGSTFVQGTDFMSYLQNVISTPATEVDARGMVKWMEVDLGQIIGAMGVKYDDPAKVEKMKDYVMPGGRMERVKVAAGNREPTSLLSVITANIGKTKDGRDVLSLVTMFPGTNTIGGHALPFDRGQFASQGFYFALPEDSPMLG